MTLHNKTNFSILTGYTLALSNACEHAHARMLTTKKTVEKGSHYYGQISPS